MYGQPAEGVLSRNEWLATLARTLGTRLEKNPDLSPAPDLVAIGGEDLTAATVVARVASMHANGLLLEAIVARVIEGAWAAEGADPGGIALAGISTYRGGRFPEPDWWDAGLLEASLLECWADQALSVVTRTEVESLLRDRWLVEEEAIQEISTGLGHPKPMPLEAIAEVASRSPQVAALLGLESTASTVEQELNALPLPAADHERLRELASANTMRRRIAAYAEELEAEGQGDAAEELKAVSAELREVLKAQLMALSTFEGAMLVPQSQSSQVLRRAALETKRRTLLVSLADGLALPNGLSDRFDGVTLTADWLADYVFSAGARSGLSVWGPTAYLWLALERHEIPADGELPPISFSLLEPRRHPVEFMVGIGGTEESPIDDDTLVMRYGMGHSDETRRWLAMLVLSRQVMIDIFAIDPAGSLQLLRRIAQPVDEVAKKIEATAAQLVEREGLKPLITGRELEDHVLAGFELSENAKSELLLTISADAETEAEEVSRARRALLDAHLSRARALYSRGDPTDPERWVDVAMRRYAEARSRIGRTNRVHTADEPEERHRELVRDFAREGRAVVHFNFKSSHLQGFWSANEGESKGWLSGEAIDITALTEATAPWLEGSHGDVDALLTAAEPIAAELDEALDKEGVDEVVIVPWALLHGVPFAAVPLPDSVLGDRYRVSYAPSLAVLRPLLAPAPHRHEIELVAAHGGSLPWADGEIAAAKEIHPSATVTPDGSPRDQVLGAMARGRILHLATHGEWWRADHFASSLDLCLDGVFDRHISAAEVHRDIDLTGVELVLLSACDTGRSPSLHRGIESYSGLDAAFLARGARAVVSTLWPINDLAAMIFTTSLHAELVGGQTLTAAFERSIELLRSGAWKDLTPDDPLGRALDASSTDWRSAAPAAADAFRAPKIWAAFRLSGVPWLSQPIPR
jgi:CHAT domain-containing protein